MRSIIVIAASLLFLAGCETPRASSQAPREVIWRTLGSWNGRGGSQTESFTSDTGGLRLRWRATNEPRPGAGRFRVTLHSAISGRALGLVVDHTGGGGDIAYMQEDPRVFFAVVDSADVDWTFTIEEAVSMQPQRR